jgi:hypothetical protein
MDHSLHVGSCVSVHLFTTPKLEIPLELSNPFAPCVGAVVRGLTLLVPYQSPHPAGITHIRGISGEAGNGVSGKRGRVCGVSSYQGWKFAWSQHTSIYRKGKRMRTGASVDKEKIKEEIKQELKDQT